MFRVRCMTLRELCTDVWWTMIDYVRAAWQLGIELTRGIGTVRRRKLLPHRKEAMPELVLSADRKEETNSNNDERKSQNGSPRRLRPRRVPQSMNRQRLEPAFPKDSDYPPDWMVFHPVLGVVKKEVADEYERRRNNGVTSKENDFSTNSKQPHQSESRGSIEGGSSSEKENGVSSNCRTENHSQPEKQDCEKENDASSDSSTENCQPKKKDCEKENGHQRSNGVQFHDGISSSLVVGPSSPNSTAARCIAASS
jgi:hypothetical protein